MGRKVSVTLEAVIDRFIAPMGLAKKETDELGDKVDKLDRELDKIPPDAAKAAAAMKLLGTEADVAGKKVGEINEKRTNLAALDSKIRDTSKEVRKLADEFRKTGDVDVFKKLGDAQGRLSALQKIRKELAQDIEDGVKDGIENLGSGEFPGLQQVALQVGAALSPALFAAVGGALTGAVGLGVGGLGLAGAVLGDPQKFQNAWTIASHSVKNDFIEATRPFTTEVFDGLSRIGPLVESWNLKKIFADAEKYAQPLFAGIEGLSTGLVKGVGALVEKGAPAVDALSESMIILGNSAGSAMASIADGAQGGADALHDLSTGIGHVIEGLGKVVEGSELAYGYIHDHAFEPAVIAGTLGGSLVIGTYEKLNSETSKLVFMQDALQKKAEAAGHTFNQQGDDLTALSQKLSATAVTTDQLAGAMENKLFTALMNIDQASLSVAESHTRLAETLEESQKVLGKHANQLDLTTKRGQANEEAILAAVSANQQLYQAQIAAGMSAEDAAAQYDANSAALEKQLKDAGLAQDQIEGLIGKYRKVPPLVNTMIAIDGLTNAINELDHTLRLIAGLRDKDVYVRVHNVVYDDTTGRRMTGNSRLGSTTERYGGIVHRAAAGMIVPPSAPGTVLFGEPETGGEAYIPLRGISQMRAMSLAQTVGNGYGFSVTANGGMPRELVLQATFLDPHTGDVMRRQAISWSLDRGRDPADFFTAN